MLGEGGGWMSDGEGFFFPFLPVVGAGWRCGRLTCGLRVETASHLSQRLTRQRSFADQLWQSHWATGQAGQG